MTEEPRDRSLISHLHDLAAPFLALPAAAGRDVELGAGCPGTARILQAEIWNDGPQRELTTNPVSGNCGARSISRTVTAGSGRSGRYQDAFSHSHMCRLA